jgi:hypothetical protein
MQTITTTTLHPGWRVQLAVHRAVRRDGARLAAALAEGQATSASGVRLYWAATAEQLHEHHVFEDTVVWPLLGERFAGSVDALLARNAGEHAAMAAAMEEFGDVVSTMTTDTRAARAALARLNDAIETHLAHEEADVLPMIPEAFTLADIQRFSAESAKTNPPDAFLPWLLDGAPEDDVAFFTGHMPEPVKSALDSDWIPRWHVKVDALRALEPLSTR